MSVLSRAARKSIKNFRLRKYRHHAHEQRYNWDWRGKRFNRIALVNHLVAANGGWDCNYLEIGCASNALFDSVAAKNKIGVDPASGGTHRMTSDDFFSSNENVFDVIFVDGLHEYQQVRRDAINALQWIGRRGWIAFHDFLPSDWKEQHSPRIQSAWTGDCWKFAVELCAARGVEFRIVNIDHGVGLLKKVSDIFVIPDLNSELAEAGFDRFVSEVQNFPIIDFDDAVKLINTP